MPIKSMTGFGKFELSRDGFTVRVEMKSVNNRFLELQLRTMRIGFELEQKLRQVCSRIFHRGSVTCSIEYESTGAQNEAIQLNESILEGYLAVLKKLQDKFPEISRIELGQILRLPDLIQSDLSPSFSDNQCNVILQCFEKACLQLDQMRKQEGGNLKTHLDERLNSIKNTLIVVQSVLPERQKEFQAKLKNRMLELLSDHEIDENRILTEVGIMAEKLDISEEIVRMQSHLQLFQETLDSPESSGKRLGFLQQEMLREVNTMGSKGQHSKLIHKCVEMKEDLEIIREQIQNIE